MVAGVKNIIAIGSGKGGVGKSTMAVNLALALHHLGTRVGLLDADIYGPSVPTMVGAVGIEPQTTANKKLIPVQRHGIQTMSIGYLVDTAAAMAWRGPMVSSALQQLLNDTQWDNLDYLLIDLPPGTGDIQLTLSQKIPVSAAVVVTTPQDLALIDARRAIAFFRKVNIPVLGIVENMSTHVCTHCGHEEAIFAANGGVLLAEEMKTLLLGQIPLAAMVCAQTDSGIPTAAAAQADNALKQRYIDIASKMSALLSDLRLSTKPKFPKITIVKT